MKFKILIKIFAFIFIIISCKENSIEYPKFVELQSGNQDFSLYLKNNTFEFLKREFVSYDQIITSTFTKGNYTISKDKLILTSKTGKNYIFEIGNELQLIPQKMDSIKNIKTLFPIKIFHDNMMPKSIGNRDSLGQKNSLWLYFDEKGKSTNQQLFKNGKLIKDKYKSNIIVK